MQASVQRIIDEASRVILGKEHALRLALACFLARGHLLIEDVPGIGKTTFSRTLAGCLGLAFKRVQFTSDLLPTDITGVNVYDSGQGRFQFHPGPVFTQFLLADEINRSSPKTQSALLEAMEENQVTVDGVSHGLPEPFFVVATQNPLRQIGTYPLPEAQLDRFLMRIELGYPGREAERLLLQGHDRKALLDAVAPQVDAQAWRQWPSQASAVYVDERVLDYVHALVQFSRASDFVCGLSPRAGLALLQSAKAWAWMENRDYVLPDDVQYVFAAVANHRLHFTVAKNTDPASLIMQSIDAP